MALWGDEGRARACRPEISVERCWRICSGLSLLAVGESSRSEQVSGGREGGAIKFAHLALDEVLGNCLEMGNEATCTKYYDGRGTPKQLQPA